MNQLQFKTAAHAKCILAGEHIVMYGMPAIVFPVINKQLKLLYEFSRENFTVDSNTQGQNNSITSFLSTLQAALNLVKYKEDIQALHGKFLLENNIPIGAGIGFSAALCIVVTRFLIWKNLLKENKLFPFAQHLENNFHGKSSGLDIMGAMNDDAIHYEITGHTHPIKMQWHPYLYLSYSGIAKNTKVAIEHVSEIRKNHPKLSRIIDKEMQQSVIMIEKAFNENKKHGLSLLVDAINHANHCFLEWNLIPQALASHCDELKSMGALAVKPTGAGEGGYVLSIWEDVPPKNEKFELIPLITELEKNT